MLLKTGISGIALKTENMEKFYQSQTDDVFVLCYGCGLATVSAVLLKLWIQVSTNDWGEKQGKLGLSQIHAAKISLISKLVYLLLVWGSLCNSEVFHEVSSRKSNLRIAFPEIGNNGRVGKIQTLYYTRKAKE